MDTNYKLKLLFFEHNPQLAGEILFYPDWTVSKTVSSTAAIGNHRDR